MDDENPHENLNFNVMLMEILDRMIIFITMHEHTKWTNICMSNWHLHDHLMNILGKSM